MRVALAAPAKVNLHLDVLDRRPDGFHDLVSLFQAVDLADTLRLERTGTDGPVSIVGMADVEPSANSIVRAIELFRVRAGVREAIRASVEKRIPMGAGFGGGSSDAAAALRCCQALFGSPLGEAEIDDCARLLGSDVPFFLAGPAALVEGRGERCRRIAARTDFSILAATPRVRVSTTDAFAWLDAGRARAGSPARPADPAREIERAYDALAPDAWRFSNSFDGPVMERLPAIAALRDVLRQAGASDPRLTGSGSTVIAVFADAAAASALHRSLALNPPAAVAASDIRLLVPLASLPGVEYYG